MKNGEADAHSDGDEVDESDSDTLSGVSDDDDITKIRRAHLEQARAMSARGRRPGPRSRTANMSFKRKLEAVKTFADFTKKLKQDTGISIRSLKSNSVLGLEGILTSESEESSDDGISEEEFEVNPQAVEELNAPDESYIDPETGDIVEAKKKVHPPTPPPPPPAPPPEEPAPEPKTLTIGDIINDNDLDLSKPVEIAEMEGGELEKNAEELLKEGESSQDFDITEKLKEMGEISVKPVRKEEDAETPDADAEKSAEGDDEKKSSAGALNVRRNIREVMDEKQLDASTLAAQRQESERLARVQEQQRIIREVQRQIAMNRQNKAHARTLALLQGGGSLLKKGAGQKLNLPNTVLVKLASGDKKKPGQVELTRVAKPLSTDVPSPSSGLVKPVLKSEKKEVVEIVSSSSSGEESSSSSSDSDDCIMLSDSEVAPSPEPDDDPNNSGMHVNDTYNIPDDQGRVIINIGHPENEEDIFLAPQIARVIKPHQIGGVRFLFDNIIESVERFSTSTGFGCILAHSMGLGKTLQICCFCDIFLRHTTFKTVLCIMPINTLQNWVAEFNMWLPMDASTSPLGTHGEVRTRNFPIYVLNDSHKTLAMRAKVVQDWKTTGGVLMIGYELYRLLSMKKDKKPRRKKKADKEPPATPKSDKDKNDKSETGKEGDDTQGSSDTTPQKPEAVASVDATKTEDAKTEEGEIKQDAAEEKKEDDQTDEDKKLLDEMYEALVKPGPDLVICDEGHRIKNSHSNISYALKQMRTKRRIVLTGYPLQNNLLEYWCMVDFVRPNYLGTKTEFSNMFERPIQNGQCIDSTPQDIRLMRYRAHVLHSLLVGFVQRRSHAVLQSTLPQKEEYVLLVRMTPLQRQLYDRFMNEVVRTKSVPNPLKAFAICCKIWNHPDVLYYFLKKRSETNAMIEEDLDLEEIGGATKSRMMGRGAGRPRAVGRTAKPRNTRANKQAAAKKPAATIPPNTSSGPPKTYPEGYNSQYPYGPPNSYAPSQQYGAEQQGPYPPYPGYQNQQGYYPPPAEGGYNPTYQGNYYQQPPYGNNAYPNQYPQNNQAPDYNPGYNANNTNNYWGSEGYYGQPGYNYNQQYPSSQPPPEYQANPQEQPNYDSSQPYSQQFPGGPPSSFNIPPNPPYPNNQSSEQYPQNRQGPEYPDPNFQSGPGFPAYPPTQPQEQPTYPNGPPPAEYTPGSYGNNSYNPYNPQTQPAPYPGYDPNRPAPSEYANYGAGQAPSSADAATAKPAIVPPNPEPANLPVNPPYSQTDNLYAKDLGNESQTFPIQNDSNDVKPQFPNYPQINDTKPPLDTSDDPMPAWPLVGALKSESDLAPVTSRTDVKTEVKSESDTEVKIEDLDTKKIIPNEDVKSEKPKKEEVDADKKDNDLEKEAKSEKENSDEDTPKKGKKSKNPKDAKNKKSEKDKAKPKPKAAKSRAKSAKDRKSSKENPEGTDSDAESEKEEKLNKEEEAALAKKAEEMTYDWATELLKDYIPGVIENSAKMELFFLILNESIKMGDRLLLFSQSLFTLNLIEDFLERNYIPNTQTLWERNTSYYRLDGSTSALEREKLINEFNANPNIYLFLVSTRAGSLGINLVGANRVIVFDASWNPCHDTQAVCRVYRYGQKKPCFVYRFVMDYCLEKKIYDRQINKQGMADRVVDECNPDAVLSMKEITNLCWDNDEKEPEKKDLSKFKDKYVDVMMQKIIEEHPNTLSKEPFQHESLLVDRKEKKLSSAEKRLAKRGYELEKKAASAPKPTTAYRTIRTADGNIIQRPVASVRPMQHGARWIPADVWRRQGMTAQEMTLPLDVVIPTNSAEKTNIVLKAGQRVMVLKSPKGIYMQLESGKIIAIKTSMKMGQKPGENKDNPVGKKIIGNRPQAPQLPGSLKNNSAITVIPKSGNRPMQKIVTRPTMLGPNKLRPLAPGQFRPRAMTPGQRPILMRRVPTPQFRGVRPNLAANLLNKHREAKIEKEAVSPSSKMDIDDSDGEAQVLDSSDEKAQENKNEKEAPKNQENGDKKDDKAKSEESSSDAHEKSESRSPQGRSEPINLLSDEKLPNDSAFDDRSEKTSKTSLLKNYRHRPAPKSASAESSLSRLERTASAVVSGSTGAPDFRRSLDDITHSYTPAPDERPGPKSRKKKPPPKKSESEEPPVDTQPPAVYPQPAIVPHPGLPSSPSVSHTVHSTPHPATHQEMAPLGMHGTPQASHLPQGYPIAPGVPADPVAQTYGHYPGYAAGYGAGYPPPAPYYPGYAPGYYPPFPAPYPPHPAATAPPSDTYAPTPPTNHQW